MKKQLYLLVIFSLFSFALTGQKNVPATIKMKDGTAIEIHHFGKLTCESNPYAETYTTVRGKYNQSPTEIKEYSNTKQLVLEGFTEPPMRAAGNQKGAITVIRKNGVNVTLEDAELVMSCYGAGELFNQIKVQVINPLTDEAVEQTLHVREIVSVTFK
ncbi:MAG: hypothetical protein JXK95_14825 [Bacteroidales bacterium]|nr:hypothetical protein [Bacteroidales bacterium]